MIRKTFFLLTFVLLSASISFSQKCKPKYTDKDSFTGEKVEYWGGFLTSMSVYSFNVQFTPSLYATKKEGKDKLVFGMAFRSKLRDISDMKAGDAWFEKGSKIVVRLSEGFEEFIVEKGYVNNAGYSSAEITVSMTPEQLENLSTKKMEKVRIFPFKDNTDDYFQFSVSKGRNKKIMQQLVCFGKL